MKFFLDTANLAEIKHALDWRLLDGVTTNPTLISREQVSFEAVVREICRIVPGHVSLETTTTTAEEIVKEGQYLAAFGKNVVVKVAVLPEGLKAAKVLEETGIPTNVTLVFSANQALLAAKAGASFVSPFIGRLDDVGQEGMQVVKQTLEIFKQYAFKTQVIVASIRHPLHVLEAARLGAPIATMPFKVMEALYKHPLTDHGLKMFLEDWKKVKRTPIIEHSEDK
jgi:transaldolase